MKNLTKSKVPKFQRELPVELYSRRRNLSLTQAEVAELLDKSEQTYQRWESTGNGLSNIQDILRVFEVFKFSTSTVIKLFNLPPLTLDELKDIVPDADTLKCIKEEGICAYIDNNCGDMDNLTIEKLLVILHTEHLKRLGFRRKK